MSKLVIRKDWLKEFEGHMYVCVRAETNASYDTKQGNSS